MFLMYDMTLNHRTYQSMRITNIYIQVGASVLPFVLSYPPLLILYKIIYKIERVSV